MFFEKAMQVFLISSPVNSMGKKNLHGGKITGMIVILYLKMPGSQTRGNPGTESHGAFF